MAGKKVAFIGLGVMGYPMAGHLTAKNFDVTVYNRTAAKARSWTKKYRGKIAKTPALAAQGRDVVSVCVGNDDDVRSVVYGDDGAFAGMKRSAVLVDHTSVSAELARELDAAAKERGLRFVDGPISGGQTGAEAGALTIMCGGDPSSFKKAKPVMNAYAIAVTLMGPAGAGQLTKMVNQICVAGIVQGLAEALTFAKKAGLPGELVVDTISKGAAQSWQMDNRAKILLKDMFDGGFSVQWMRKDAGMVLGEADRNGARLPLMALLDQYYKQIQTSGGSRWDTSSMMRLLTRD